MISNQQLFEKLTLLDASQKQTVYEFIDFLLSKRLSKKRSTSDFLLQTSIWSNEEVQQIEDTHEAFNRWQPATW